MKIILLCLMFTACTNESQIQNHRDCLEVANILKVQAQLGYDDCQLIYKTGMSNTVWNVPYDQLQGAIRGIQIMSSVRKQPRIEQCLNSLPEGSSLENRLECMSGE